ncbi:MAG: radical SAM family heme chaperone HemW [Bacteroidales bacterium]|nr:radical SAM family heme chaperone HemW [Bacteroidales bacterium]
MIYVHIPFCHRKCSYCAFYSVVVSAQLEPFTAAMCREIEQREWHGGVVRTVYFGGGTPSLLPIDNLAAIVGALRNRFDLSSVEEATIECNPEDLTPQYLKALLELNIFNRLSIGIQSFSNFDLKTLNRRHTAEQAIEAVENAAHAGFSNISIDLIYGLPGATTEDWQHNLEIVSKLPSAVKHISAYSLTVEENTILSRQISAGKVAVAAEEVVVEQYNVLTQWAEANGFAQYEVSNFAKAGYHSRHNSRYWTREPYIGFGPSAHSFDGYCRRWNTANLKDYVSTPQGADVPHGSEILSEADAYNELVITSLRTTAGICKNKIPLEYRQHLCKTIKPFINSGLIRETSSCFEPTAAGLLHADGIAVDLMV